MFTCKMGTVILTLSISVRMKLYKVSTSVGEFLACISCFLLFVWAIPSRPPTTTALPPLPNLISTCLCPQRSHFFNHSSSFTLSWLHISLFPLQMNYLTNLCVVPITFAPVVHVSLSSLPGTSPSQSLPLLLLLQPLPLSAYWQLLFYPPTLKYKLKFIFCLYICASVSVKNNII